MSGSSARVRTLSIVSFSVLGCALGAIAYSFNADPLLAATGLGDDGMLEVRIPQPLAGASPAAPRLEQPALGAAKPLDAMQNPGSAKGNPLWGIPLHSLSATRERPLFSPSRRPPPKVVAAPPPPPPPKPAPPARPSLTLVGTAIGPTQSIGIFVDQATRNVIRLRTGEGHDGWTLRAIHGRDAVFEEDRREAVLALPNPGGTARESAALPAPAMVQPPVPSLSQRADQERPVAPPGMWVDGDGQVITPPRAQTGSAESKSPPATWVDGDGQLISPPSGDSKPLGAAVWRDGDGQSIAPPLAQITQTVRH